MAFAVSDFGRFHSVKHETSEPLKGAYVFPKGMISWIQSKDGSIESVSG
jgi:hypothetical protein